MAEERQILSRTSARQSVPGRRQGSTQLAKGETVPPGCGVHRNRRRQPAAAAAPRSRRYPAADVVPVVAAVAAEVERRRRRGRVDGGADDVPALAAASVVARQSFNAPDGPVDVDSKDAVVVGAEAVVGAADDVVEEAGVRAADGESDAEAGAATPQTAAVAGTRPRRQTAAGGAADTPPGPQSERACHPAVAARRPSARRRGDRTADGEALYRGAEDENDGRCRSGSR